MQIGDRVVAGWSDLTDAEHHLLSEALEPGPYSFYDILNGWVVGTPDGGYWNRKWAYVGQLVPAAVGLVRAGLLAVEVAGPDGRAVMSPHDAEQAVSDVDNWWSYEPSEAPDPVDAWDRAARRVSARAEPGSHPDAGWHSIAETELVGQLRRDEPATRRRPRARPITSPAG